MQYIVHIPTAEWLPRDPTLSHFDLCPPSLSSRHIGFTSSSPIPRPGSLSPRFIRNSLRLPDYNRQIMLNLAMTRGGLREQRHEQQHAEQQLDAYRLNLDRLDGRYSGVHVDDNGLVQGLPGHRSSGLFAVRKADGTYTKAGRTVTVDTLVRLGLRRPEYFVLAPSPGTFADGLPRNETKSPDVEYEI